MNLAGSLLGRAVADTRASLGRWGEEQALCWLEARGYRVLARNRRLGARGEGARCRAPEVDLLACREGALWLIEVKCRRRPGLGQLPLLSERQRRRLYRALLAQAWAGPRHLGLLWIRPGREVVFLENP